ncbi:hypothetical protein PE066_05375 [Ramlibacter tataouinensis]|uniref:hypothetical protein n=1 Tax=Ramlibacter tataouinensis TaxID=94132 RepID=UPI0022F3DF98|nr:hypothetical protein [Ramlibacter tataouinensis]WBY02968.1 hypothetical protein PE066_05375 [Ramlibacter tataouinensis]
MSARAPMAVHPQARSRVRLIMEPTMDTPAESRRAVANCGACGRAWFGQVAFCPYCGHRSERVPAASAPAPAADGHAKAALADGAPGRPSGSRRPAAWKPILALIVAAALVMVPLALEKLAATPGDEAGLQGASRAPAVNAGGKGTPGASDRVSAPRGAAAPARAPASATTTATMGAPPAPNGSASASTAQAPAAEPARPRGDRAPPLSPAPAPAAAAPGRSLCSVASEAAGLCKPQ